MVGQALARDDRDHGVKSMSREDLPGAVSLPLDELHRRLDDVPADQEVVAYCRGRVCELSHEAVELLRSRGIEARATADGILGWRADGIDLVPVVAGHP